ncbi:hypothetical protein ACWOAH_10325 [Vagococcus vulneris]|uniref:Uncharacterized protein n=1 Tax=Vagococcus vulneris TaxID=1977869 RepID=A0A429ZTA8_9ENTE|nr:hypothetical protein [Vagococcus vulneris]RST96971.1 hypothetical protein CBF37_10475 [Vagococcus vulneris]
MIIVYSIKDQTLKTPYATYFIAFQKDGVIATVDLDVVYKAKDLPELLRNIAKVERTMGK